MSTTGVAATWEVTGSFDDAVVYILLSSASLLEFSLGDGTSIYDTVTTGVIQPRVSGLTAPEVTSDVRHDEVEGEHSDVIVSADGSDTAWIRIDAGASRVSSNHFYMTAGPVAGQSFVTMLPEFRSTWARGLADNQPQNGVLAMWATATGSAFSISIHSLVQVTWQNVFVSCNLEDSTYCPHGAHDEELASPGSMGASGRAFTYEVETVRPESEIDGNITLQNAAVLVIARSARLAGTGEITLANVHWSDVVESPSDQSYILEGEVILEHLEETNDHRLVGELWGSPTQVRTREVQIDSDIIFGPAAAAAAGLGLAGLLAAIKFLLPLFTRIPAAKALEHPRRKKLNQYITAHPGATFRELLRGTQIPAGTARHHLTIMRRSGIIFERRHRSTLRFYENHGKFEQSWVTVAVLREPQLQQLHDWIKANPNQAQMDILGAMNDEGWMRSTTQHRLKRLEREGLVTARPHGRRRLYEAHDLPQRPPTDTWIGLPTP
jgi:predicted transcriptional regulator